MDQNIISQRERKAPSGSALIVSDTTVFETKNDFGSEKNTEPENELNSTLVNLSCQITSAKSIQELELILSTQTVLSELNLGKQSLNRSSYRTTTKIQINLLQKLIELNQSNTSSSSVLAWFGLSPSSLQTSTSSSLPTSLPTSSQLNTLSIHPFHQIITTRSVLPSVNSIYLTLNLLSLSVKQFQLSDHYQSIFGHHPFHQPSSVQQWSSFINHFIGLPTKLANLIYHINQLNPSSDPIQIPNQFQSRPFLIQISHQFNSLIKLLSSSEAQIPPEQIITEVTILLNKLINIGFVTSVIPQKSTVASIQEHQQPFDFLSSIWFELITNILEEYHHKSNKSYFQLWNSIICGLPRTESKSFILSFLIHLQSYLTGFSLQQHQSNHFSTDAINSAIELAGAEILNLILGAWGSKNSFGTTDLYQLVIEILTEKTTPVWNILLGRTLVRWTTMVKDCDRNDDVMSPSKLLARSALASFGSHHQIANGHPSQQAFLLVLILLTSLSIKSFGKQSQQKLDELTLDPIFINSIQRSLSSLRTQFRLLGMLMAELLTEIKQSSSGIAEEDSKKLPKLDFGHDFEAFDDEENQLCVKIRNLCNQWNPSPQSKNHHPLWIQVLSDSLNKHTQKSLSSQLTQALQLGNPAILPHHTPLEPNIPHQRLSSCTSHDEPIDNPHLSKLLVDTDKHIEDPNQFTSTELCLSVKDRQAPSTRHQTPSRPKIEILDDVDMPTIGDPSLEPFEIPPEDLASLHPPKDSLTDHSDPHSTTLQHEVDYSMMKDSDQGKKSLVYLSQLSDCLKDSSQSFDKLQIGLLQAEQLIRRKMNWGNELLENAIDLTFTVLNLQDNYEFDGFEIHRQKILVSLIVGLPSEVGPCLIEQLFYHQYTVSQRLTILNSIIMATLELAGNHQEKGPQNVDVNGFKRFQSDHIHHALLEFQSLHSSASSTNQKCLGQSNQPKLIMDYLQDGDDNGQGNVSPDYFANQPKPKWISKKLELKRNSHLTNHDHQPDSKLDPKINPRTFQPNNLMKTPNTMELVEMFLTSMMSRLNWYLDQFNNHQPNTTSKPFSGAGWMICFEPLVLTKLIETLKLLIFLLIDSNNLLNYLNSKNQLTPKLMELIKELVILLVKIIKLLLQHNNWTNPNQRNGGDIEEEGGVNDHMVINCSLQLIFQVLINLSFNDHHQPTQSFNSHSDLIAIGGQGSNEKAVLLANLKELRLNQLLNQLMDLINQVNLDHFSHAHQTNIQSQDNNKKSAGSVYDQAFQKIFLDCPVQFIPFNPIFNLISSILDLV